MNCRVWRLMNNVDIFEACSNSEAKHRQTKRKLKLIESMSDFILKSDLEESNFKLQLIKIIIENRVTDFNVEYDNQRVISHGTFLGMLHTGRMKLTINLQK